MRRPRTAAALALLLFPAALLAACASPAPAPTESVSPGAGAPSSPAATPDATGTAPEADPTCETIIPDATVDDFEGLGWTYQEAPFFVGATELPGGLQCTWGDFTVASDHVQMYGWASITEADAETAQTELLDGGWRTIDDDSGVYITENADTAVATDDEGYGITYLFGDGWVKVADTKQSLLLVEWPRA